MRNRDFAYIALFAAFTAVLGLVPPIELGFVPTPITAQTLGVMLPEIAELLPRLPS